ncbi:hypothetical protein UFOVP116_363 [uncultured Caudovirales phage]|uniref:Uncharacterized protein n=1 Tax=uncultured Caudovirales phage TaxID=2100421 RepID=A0A6J5LB70_9CAUD|nr:hypothetical protein UFOVP116_363 [uncultured Caudovirales phage]
MKKSIKEGIGKAMDKKQSTLPASTPRNFVAKNAKSSGAGVHADKKKDAKRGIEKHKKGLTSMAEGRESQRHPLEDHEYHKKSNAELIHIAKDAREAAAAMKSHNTTAENKYSDQANDSATVRYWRQKNGMPEWYKKKYGHETTVSESAELEEAQKYTPQQISDAVDEFDNLYLKGSFGTDYRWTDDDLVRFNQLIKITGRNKRSWVRHAKLGEMLDVVTRQLRTLNAKNGKLAAFTGQASTAKDLAHQIALHTNGEYNYRRPRTWTNGYGQKSRDPSDFVKYADSAAFDDAMEWIQSKAKAVHFKDHGSSANVRTGYKIGKFLISAAISTVGPFSDNPQTNHAISVRSVNALTSGTRVVQDITDQQAAAIADIAATKNQNSMESIAAMLAILKGRDELQGIADRSKKDVLKNIIDNSKKIDMRDKAKIDAIINGNGSINAVDGKDAGKSDIHETSEEDKNKQGAMDGHLSEIDYADSLDSSSFDPNKLMQAGKVVGNIEGNDVYELTNGDQTVYILAVDGKASAFVGFEGKTLKNIKNFTQAPGAMRALIGYLVHKKNIPLNISSDEPLTADGLKWIIRLINDPRGLIIKDQNGKDIDPVQLKQEWQSAKKTGSSGTISITITENVDFGNKLRKNENKRSAESLLMPVNFYSVRTTAQRVVEGSENNNPTANKIFFARSNKAPKGWSYDHIGFITQDGKQIQMSGHKGNDVYATNAVTDDPEFPKQNIKIVSLSKPVSVPTTNSVGAENCGTFVANVLQANGIKGIDTQKIYSVFKKPQEQSVVEGNELDKKVDANIEKHKKEKDLMHKYGEKMNIKDLKETDSNVAKLPAQDPQKFKPGNTVKVTLHKDGKTEDAGTAKITRVSDAYAWAKINGETIQVLQKNGKEPVAAKAPYHVFKLAESTLNELSSQTLASYKKKAGADASEADKRGDFKQGDKRFKGIVQATKKQFANDSKESVKENTQGGFSPEMIATLKSRYNSINTIDPAGPTYKQLLKLLESLDQLSLQQLAGAGIKFVSALARNRVKA